MSIELFQPQPIAGPDLRSHPAMLLRIYINDEALIEDPDTDWSENPYEAFHWLDSSWRILRTDQPCVFYEECTVDHLDWRHAGMPAPLGIGWPRLVGNETPFYSLASNVEAWNASLSDNGRRLEIPLNPDLAGEEFIRFEGTLQYGRDRVVPTDIDGVFFEGRPLEFDAKLARIEWQVQFEAPEPWKWGYITPESRTTWPVLFHGADRRAFQHDFTFLDALEVLRNDSQEADEILREGGCVSTYGLTLQDEVRSGTEETPVVGAATNETETTVIISLADSAGQRTQWSLHHHSGNMLQDERWEVGNRQVYEELGDCENGQAFSPRVSLQGLANLSRSAPWGDAAEDEVAAAFVSRLQHGQEWLADDGLEIVTISHAPTQAPATGGLSVTLMYSISVRTSTGLANWMNIPPESVDSLNQGEWPPLPPQGSS